MVYMGGKGRYNASRSNQTTHFGIMGGLAPMTNVAAGVRMFRLRRARNRQTIPLLPIPGKAYMVAHNILSKNPEGAGGVGSTSLLVEREMGPIDPEPEQLLTTGTPPFVPECKKACEQCMSGSVNTCPGDLQSCMANRCGISGAHGTEKSTDWNGMFKDLVMAQVLHSRVGNVWGGATLSFFADNRWGLGGVYHPFVYVSLPRQWRTAYAVQGPYHIAGWTDALDTSNRQEGWAIYEWKPSGAHVVHYLIYANRAVWNYPSANRYSAVWGYEVCKPEFTDFRDDGHGGCLNRRVTRRPSNQYTALIAANTDTTMVPNHIENSYYFPRPKTGFAFPVLSTDRLAQVPFSSIISAEDYFWSALGEARWQTAYDRTNPCDEWQWGTNPKYGPGVCQAPSGVWNRPSDPECVAKCNAAGGFGPFLGLGLRFKVISEDLPYVDADGHGNGLGPGAQPSTKYDKPPKYITIENGGPNVIGTSEKTYYPAFRFWYHDRVPDLRFESGYVTKPVYTNQGYPPGKGSEKSPPGQCQWQPSGCGPSSLQDTRTTTVQLGGSNVPASSLVNLPHGPGDWDPSGGGGYPSNVTMFDTPAKGWTVVHQPGTDDNATAIRINGVPVASSRGATFASGVSLITAWTATKPNPKFACGRGCHANAGPDGGEGSLPKVCCWQQAQGPLPGQGDCPMSYIVLSTPRYPAIRYVLEKSGVCAIEPTDGQPRAQWWCNHAAGFGLNKGGLPATGSDNPAPQPCRW